MTKEIIQMASNIKQLDPVQGLVSYVQDIKPFHTKIVEVLVEYVYTEGVETSIGDSLEIGIGLDFGGNLGPLLCAGGYDTLPYDSLGVYPIASPNTGITFSNYPAINVVTNSITIPGNFVSQFVAGSVVTMYSVLEDHTNALPISGVLLGSPANDFQVTGDHTATYVAGFSFDVYGSIGNDGTYTTSAGGATFAAGVTTIPVDEAIPSAVVGGKIGIITTPGSHTGQFTVLDATFDAGSIDVWTSPPNLFTLTPGDEASTVVRFVEALSVIPALSSTQFYSAYVENVTIQINDALPSTEHEGYFVTPLTGITASSFTIGVDLADNLRAGDTFSVDDSTGNDGTYTITTITSGASNTTIGVQEAVADLTIDGTLTFRIGSNVFIVSGNYSTRFIQGRKLDVVGGDYVGTYNVLRSDFVDGNTRIRVLEKIPASTGSPAPISTIEDYAFGYDEFVQLCGMVIPPTQIHGAFCESLEIRVYSDTGSPPTLIEEHIYVC